MINREDFPIFDLETSRKMALIAKRMCLDGIRETDRSLSELFVEYDSLVIDSERDECADQIAENIAHQTFCLDQLEFTEVMLGRIAPHFN